MVERATEERGIDVLMIRHGRSESNALGRWQGRADSPLDDVGRAQATAAAVTLDDTLAVGVWSSPLRRALETGSIIAARLGLAAPTVDDRLVETDVGEWQGLTSAEIEERYPGFLAARRRPPTFESATSTLQRTVDALRDIAASIDDDSAAAVAIVTAHSGVIRTLVRALGADDERVPNLGAVRIRVAPDAAYDATSPTGVVSGIVLLGRVHLIDGDDVVGDHARDETDQPDGNGEPER